MRLQLDCESTKKGVTTTVAAINYILIPYYTHTYVHRTLDINIICIHYKLKIRVAVAIILVVIFYGYGERGCTESGLGKQATIVCYGCYIYDLCDTIDGWTRKNHFRDGRFEKNAFRFLWPPSKPKIETNSKPSLCQYLSVFLF